MTLIEPDKYRPIVGLQIPQELYWVLTSPAPLAGIKYPGRDFPWLNIAEEGFSKVVALHPGEYDPNPLSILFSEQLEDLVHGNLPKDAEREVRIIKSAVLATVDALYSGQGVVVHCWGGRGRTGTVLGCVLRKLGHKADTVVQYLDRVHKSRGRTGWPESPWQSDLVKEWNA